VCFLKTVKTKIFDHFLYKKNTDIKFLSNICKLQTEQRSQNVHLFSPSGYLTSRDGTVGTAKTLTKTGSAFHAQGHPVS
jgi:hypothetical protein